MTKEATMSREEDDEDDTMDAPPSNQGGDTAVQNPHEPSYSSPSNVLQELMSIGRLRSNSRSGSNPRTRTPTGRYESPLLNVTPNRMTVREEEEEMNRLVSIRVGAGSAVGSSPLLTTTSIREGAEAPLRQRHPHRSSKQSKPSERKLRRWNNDKFAGVAADLARNSRGGAVTADIFLSAEAEKSLYIRPVAVQNRSEFEKLMKSEDARVVEVRERFVRGELGKNMEKLPQIKQNGWIYRDGGCMFSRMHHRLKSVVTRACSNSNKWVDLINAFETYLIAVYKKKKKSIVLTELMPIFLNAPEINKHDDSISIQFFFCPDSAQGAFHRLLLHAVCNFHGLQSASSSSKRHVGETQGAVGARVLTVSGRECLGCQFHLTDYALSEEENGGQNALDSCDIVKSISTLKVS